MKNVILSAAEGYGLAQIAPFIDSAAANCPNTEIVFLADTHVPEVISYGEEKGISVRYYSCGMPYLNRVLSTQRFWRRLVKGLTPSFVFKAMAPRSILQISVFRYFVALEFLRAHEGEYVNVLLSDSRDVIFQSDPFEMMPDVDGIICGQEEVSISDEKFTRGWIEKGFGPTVFTSVKDQTVICSGVSIGTYAHICSYLETYVARASEIKHLIPFSYGFDQGIHNVLIYHDHSVTCERIENGQGVICTLSTCGRGRFEVENRVLTFPTTQISPAIVHQHDRHAGVEQALGWGEH